MPDVEGDKPKLQRSKRYPIGFFHMLITEVQTGSSHHARMRNRGTVNPWTNGQVERMNRTIKETTVKRFHIRSHDLLRTHLAAFLNA